MMKRIALGSAAVIIAAVVAFGLLGTDTALAKPHGKVIAGIMGIGTVATGDSEFAKGFKFTLHARVREGGTARGRISARIHMKGADGERSIVRVRGRFYEGAIDGNNATLSGVAKVRLASGEIVKDVPLTVGVIVRGHTEYEMTLEFGDRLLEGEGIEGNVTIFRDIPNKIRLKNPNSVQ